MVFVVLFVSCKKEEAEKPKVTYETTSKAKPEVESDANQIEVADLPINMEGTNYLIHPIGVMSGNGKGIKSSYDSEQGFTVSNYGEYQITGYLKNLKFQEIGKDTIYALTDKQILIDQQKFKREKDKLENQMMEAEKQAKERLEKLKEYDEQKSKIQNDLNSLHF